VKSPLVEKQARFAVLLARLILWINAQGWSVTLGEGAVTERRRVKLPQRATETWEREVFAMDAVHMPGSLHYIRLAADLNLFVGGEIVRDGGHPAWQEIGRHWKSLASDAAWGGDFDSVDANHFSIREGGRA